MNKHLSPHSHKMIPLGTSAVSAGPAAWVADGYALIDVNDLITKGREGFLAVEVTGTSDVPYICPGYMAFVDTWAEPRNGSMVLALINGLACIKKFEHTERRLRLVSRNKEYKPVEITPRDDFHILGVVKGHLAVY